MLVSNRLSRVVPLVSGLHLYLQASSSHSKNEFYLENFSLNLLLSTHTPKSSFLQFTYKDLLFFPRDLLTPSFQILSLVRFSQKWLSVPSLCGIMCWGGLLGFTHCPRATSLASYFSVGNAGMGPAAEVPALPFFKFSLWAEYIPLGCFSGSSLLVCWVKSVKSVNTVLCYKLPLLCYIYSVPNTDFM